MYYTFHYCIDLVFHLETLSKFKKSRANGCVVGFVKKTKKTSLLAASSTAEEGPLAICFGWPQGDCCQLRQDGVNRSGSDSSALLLLLLMRPPPLCTWDTYAT
jgi:hypothetical protein